MLRGWKHVATAKAPAVVGQAALLPALRRGDDEEPVEAGGGKRAHTGREAGVTPKEDAPGILGYQE